MTRNEEILMAYLIPLGTSTEWEHAKTEWFLDSVKYDVNGLHDCPCSKKNIKKLCNIENITTSKTATVGSCCVDHFIGMKSNLIFDCVKRVQEDDTVAFNSETLEFAISKGFLNEWEITFYLNTQKKRSLTGKQRAARQKINQKILSKINIYI
jgi:hypothetical protein